MSQKSLIIVFVKNLVPGTVKTRLAADIGIDGALDVYQFLVEHTHEIVDKLETRKAIYYSEYVEIEDIWDTEEYFLFVQKGKDLGEKMKNAFDHAFDNMYEKVVIIGSDCYELKTSHLRQAFQKLDDHEVVIGPASDGGFYLLGMKKNQPTLFEGKKYGHNRVLQDLISTVKSLSLSYFELPVLNDIDTLEDLKDSGINFEFVDPDLSGSDEEDSWSSPGYSQDYQEDDEDWRE